MGWTFGDLGVRLGLTGGSIRAWTYNTTVHRSTASRVARLYDELWDKPGPSPKTAARARTKGWPMPLDWNDENIDDPRALSHSQFSALVRAGQARKKAAA